MGPDALPEDFSAAGELKFHEVLVDREALHCLMLANRPDVRAAQADVERRNSDVKIAVWLSPASPSASSGFGLPLVQRHRLVPFRPHASLVPVIVESGLSDLDSPDEDHCRITRLVHALTRIPLNGRFRHPRLHPPAYLSYASRRRNERCSHHEETIATVSRAHDDRIPEPRSVPAVEVARRLLRSGASTEVIDLSRVRDIDPAQQIDCWSQTMAGSPSQLRGFDQLPSERISLARLRWVS